MGALMAEKWADWLAVYLVEWMVDMTVGAKASLTAAVMVCCLVVRSVLRWAA